MTRFERQLVPSNILDQLQTLDAATRQVQAAVVVGAAERRLGIHGVVGADPQYTIKFMFSTDTGDSFSESPEVVDDLNYHVRLEISQLISDELSGFGLQWALPPGWQWVDGLSSTTYESAISNPLQVTRVARSPVNTIPSPFKVVVIEEFL